MCVVLAVLGSLGVGADGVMMRGNMFSLLKCEDASGV